MEYREDYASDPVLRHGLLEFLSINQPGYDVHLYHSLGFWDPTCRPLSFFEQSTCIANVSVIDLPLIVGGSACRAGGIQNVATHADHRGRGLCRDLLRRAIAYCDARFETTLLFTAIPDLYRRFDFRPVSDDVFIVRNPLPPRFAPPPSLCAAVEGDVRQLDELVSHRVPVSDVLGFSRQRSLFFYNELRRGLARVRLIPSLGVAAVWETQGSTLRLLDVVGPAAPSLAQIAMHLPESQRLEIWFTPDKLDAETEVRPRANDDVLMVRGPWPVESVPYAFPPTAYF